MNEKSTSAIVQKEKHFIKYVFWALFIVFAVLAIIALLKIRHLQEDVVKQQVMYENKIDSVNTADLVFMAKTFSWAIRNDLLLNNKSDAQILLNDLLKEQNVKKAYIVDAATNNIILSTDKSEVGIPCADFTIINADKSFAQKTDNNTLQIVTPIMNLNNKLAISVINLNINQ